MNGYGAMDMPGNSVVGSHPILDMKVSKFKDLSVGQSQLFALCRALLKAYTAHCAGVKPVILLDEVTSSLDSTTESTIYRIIDEEFTRKGHTIIFVAHRLSVLTQHIEVGRDVVVVMANGRLVEVITDLKSTSLENLRKDI